MGRAWKFGDNINTDNIIAGRFYPRENLAELGNFCLCENRPDFSQQRKTGDIILGGKNFGCGSSREFAVIALIHSGVKCVIAKSYARIFFRNCVNLGFPILMCTPLIDESHDGDQIEVNLGSGEIQNINTNKTYKIEPMGDFAYDIFSSGGIINYLKKNNPLP